MGGEEEGEREEGGVSQGERATEGAKENAQETVLPGAMAGFLHQLWHFLAFVFALSLPNGVHEIVSAH